MNCPKCNGPTELLLYTKSSVELRGCQKCRELWIHRAVIRNAGESSYASQNAGE